jgi:S1-C subfamily serine protease
MRYPIVASGLVIVTCFAVNLCTIDKLVAQAPPIPLASSDDADLLPEERVNIAVYERCNRSVVHIGTKSVAMESFQQLSFREGSGSGSVLDSNGLILTNQHVIDGAKEISVSLFNGLSYPAVLVGQDPDTDIAILKIDAPTDQLLPLVWGDSQHLRVGQRIYAIGNPFGLERTMSTGMISSLNRQIPSRAGRAMRSLIQIDASLNQGNSGGPLINTRGQLVGMNTAIMSSDGDSAGVGFAIPASTLQRIVPQLIQNGRVIRPSIGITRVFENDAGLLIVSVAPGGPADQAGLQGFSLVTKTRRQGPYRYEQTSIDTSTSDLIQSVDGEPVRTADELLTLIEKKNPGDIVQLQVVRAGKLAQVPVRLGEGG